MRAVPVPTASTTSSDASRRLSLLIGAGWVLGATGLQLARSGGVPVWDTLWAEDGGFFLAEALRDGWGSIFVPLSGYLQVPSRIFATVASQLPLQWASEVFALGSSLIVSLLSIYVFRASSTLIRSVAPRLLLALLFVLLPAALIESTANAANLQYFLLFACFWALIHPARSRGEVFASSAVVLATGLNTVLAWLYLPLVILRWKGASRGARLVMMLYLVAIAVQAIGVFAAVVLDVDPTLGQYPITWASSHPAELPGIFGLRVIGGLFLGIRPLEAAWSLWGWNLVIGVGSMTVLLLLMGWRRGDPSRASIAHLSAYSVAMFAVPVLLRGTEHLPTEGPDFLIAGARYTLVPIWFLFSALAVALWSGEHSPQRGVRLARTGLAALVLFSTAASFRMGTYRSQGPRWSTGLSEARRACSTLGVDGVSFPITPDGWSLTADCEALGR